MWLWHYVNIVFYYLFYFYPLNSMILCHSCSMFVQAFQLPFKIYYISGIRVPWVLSFKKDTRSNNLSCHVSGGSHHPQTQDLLIQLCLFIHMETRRLEVDRSHNSLIVDQTAQELEIIMSLYFHIYRYSNFVHNLLFRITFWWKEVNFYGFP